MNAQLEPRSDAARPVRLGFVGLGWIGRMRLDAIARTPEIEIAGLADSDPVKLEGAIAKHPEARSACDIDALLDCELDGVVIATPNSAHAAQAIACLSRGVPVFCQKPLAINAREAQLVLDAARAADRLLGVDFCYRHVQGMHELRRCVLADELGEIRSIDLTFHNAYGPDKPWAHDRRHAGGGCLLDLGVHLLDLALWLQNAPSFELVSSRLFARGEIVHGADDAVEDMAFAEFRQDGGAIVRLACSWNAHAGRDAVIGLEILGTQGGAAWRNVDGSFFDFNVDVFSGRNTRRVGAPPDEWGSRALRAWAQRLQQDRSYDPDALVFARSAQLIDEIYAS